MVLQGGALVVPNLKDAVPYFSKVLANGSVLSPVESVPARRRGPLRERLTPPPRQRPHNSHNNVKVQGVVLSERRRAPKCSCSQLSPRGTVLHVG